MCFAFPALPLTYQPPQRSLSGLRSVVRRKSFTSSPASFISDDIIRRSGAGTSSLTGSWQERQGCSSRTKDGVFVSLWGRV